MNFLEVTNVELIL